MFILGESNVLKVSLKVRIDSLIVCAFLALVTYSFLPFHFLWDFFPATVNNVGFIVLYIPHFILLVLGVIFIQQKSSSLGNFLLTSAFVFCVGGVVSWFGLTFFYAGAVGSGLRVYFVLLPIIFSIFNGFYGNMIRNLIRYFGLFFAYTLLLVLA